jgi:hypothetical protein
VYDETDLENPISLMEIHTSCSKPLFIDMVVDDSETTNNGFKLTVVDGLSGDSPAMTSIPIANPLACEDEKKKSTGSITIKKALTNDNGGTAIFADFEITVTNVETTEEFPVVIDDSGMGVKDVPAGTYTLNETHPDPGEKGTYTTVLIAGDTGCPSMLEEVFTIKKNKNLSCTIYNDDDGSSSGGTGGIIFQNNSLQILIAAPTTLDSCDNPVKPLPCVQIVEQGVLAIVDPILEENTHTIILFSVVEDEINETTGALDPKCTIDRLTHHSNITDETNDNNLTVLLDCPKINSFAKLNVNYVMIDPTM